VWSLHVLPVMCTDKPFLINTALLYKKKTTTTRFVSLDFMVTLKRNVFCTHLNSCGGCQKFTHKKYSEIVSVIRGWYIDASIFYNLLYILLSDIMLHY